MKKTYRLYRKNQFKIVSKKLKTVYFLVYFLLFSTQLTLIALCIIRVSLLLIFPGFLESIALSILCIHQGLFILSCKYIVAPVFYLLLDTIPDIICVALLHSVFHYLSNKIVELDTAQKKSCASSNINPIFLKYVAEHADFDCSQV